MVKQKCRIAVVCATVAVSCYQLGPAWGQNNNVPPSDTSQQATQPGQAFRTGDGMLEVRADLPSEVRIGERFTYNVTVQNTTDNVTLKQIELRHADQQGLTIEAIEQPKKQSSNDNPKSNNSNNSANSRSQNTPAETEKAAEQQAENRSAENNENKPSTASSDQQASQSPSENSEQSTRDLTIDSLEPGESRSFQVSASADQEGPVNACLMITNYRPTICLQTRAIKPELKIVKQAPAQNRLCEIIELTYSVTNDGTGSVGKFEIVDQLSDGLRTIDDQDQLEFTVDELKVGDTRNFVARVYATKTGSFRSRAHAKALGSELTARSENVGPEIVGADLQVDVRGSNAVPSDTPAVFTATVTNNGNASADAIQVAVHIPQDASLRRMSEVQIQDSSADGNNSQAANQAEKATGDNQQDRNNATANASTGNNRQSNTDAPDDSPQASGSNVAARTGSEEGNRLDEMKTQMRAEEFVIDRLEPGQSAQFDYVLVSRDVDQIETVVEARYVCEFDPAMELDHDASSDDVASASTRVLRLPGLQVLVLDDADPVPVGSPVTYTIRVKNEGDAKDEDIRITATLPEQLTLDSAEGPTEHQQEGSTISFNPIDQLGPDEMAEYTLTASAEAAGPTQLAVQLVSRSFSTPVESSEPTQVYDAQEESVAPEE